ncbi:hypothetical protein CN272_26485 [Bacillus anthracis]|nr:hypothetical protein CUC43_22510 [Bacillus thuringiensis LM1212]PEU89857.1 hypothetical protein CN415_20600 [Bacillus cereus]PFC82350.1 hypothetical protein CN272_26485 [Bacillus anthracis]PFT26612.1 hypothetical protein COK52_04720 [Bacillus thuringiensis]PFD83636.1 hypothetical protein CN275_27645 [Bacillus anthracis]
MKIQIGIRLTHIHKYKALNYSVYIYRMSNIIDFYLLVLQKGIYSLRMFLYIAWRCYCYFKITISK